MKCKIFLVLLITFLILSPKKIFSIGTSSCPSEVSCNTKSGQEKVDCYQNLVNNCSKDVGDLSGQIKYFNGQIKLNELNINKTENKILELEEQIASLSAKIDKLESSLSTVINVLISRVIATYKAGNGEYFSLLLTSHGFSDFLTRTKYIKVVQEHDKRLLFQMQDTKNNYIEQKKMREKKKKEQADLKITLTQQKTNLASNKKQKEVLLEATKNNETKYQQLLAEARREAEEISRAASLITSGEKKEVKKGDAIGLMGNTGFSTGAHLHFGVYNLGESEISSFNFDSSYENPFSFLSAQTNSFDATACDDTPSAQSKSIGSGGWPWPMNNPTISQCFGHTPWSWRYSIGIHNGVDMYNNNDIVIRAVDDGIAYIYRGGQANGNGIFLFHPNGKMTLYWHLQ